MRIPGFIGMIICLILVCDVYFVIRLLKGSKKIAALIYTILSLCLYAFLIVGFVKISNGQTDDNVRFMMWSGFTFLSFSFAKIIAALFDWISFIPVLWKAKRNKIIGLTGLIVSALLFLGMWWGALINRFRIDVNEVEVAIPGLPDSFDGFTIAQISDLHTGTYGSDTTFVAKLVDRINGLNADLITFTGDIVNSRTEEIIPHKSPLSRLKADYGVLSILGNHDYGDYFVWDSDKAKAANLNNLIDIQREIGWNLLLNESETIRNGEDSIVVIGVENIGDPPFKCYGSLAKAYPDINDETVKILLSHNPAHWSDSIADKENNISLTLSGHTHAMQIEMFDISPAVFKYKNWGGLYKDSTEQRKLYVNIGAGTVGLPMRFGATPEITLITLRKE